jgi:outer membrane protein
MLAPSAPALRRRAAAATALLTLATGCAVLAPGRFVERRTAPPADVAREAAARPPPPPAPKPPPPAEAPPPAAPRSLSDLVELALLRDATTRAVWQDARAAAAVAGSRRTLFLPTLDLGSTLQRQLPQSSPTRTATEQTTAGVAAGITWILLDLGARGALVDEADQLLLAARLAEHAAVADLVLRVEQTYFQFLAARALVDAQTAAVKQAERSLAAAEDRRRAGLATIAEVLQARTALSQAQLVLQQLEGQSLALRGALATLAGLPPTAELEVGALPAEVKQAGVEPGVEELLQAAAARNPDVARARAQADAAGARARAASRAYAPVLSFQADAGHTWYLSPDDANDADTWSVGFGLRFPLLEGLVRPAYDALGARAQSDAARARADATAQRVALDVWVSFQGLRTAGRRVATSRDLLASATASAQVAQGRYEEGVGSILDLLTAQAALESARAEEVRARADYLVSLAQLARATGRAELPPRPAAPPQEGRP